MDELIKCLIIGSGPAGYTAGIYLARANLSPVLYEGLAPGGQLTTTTMIDNFPGYPDGVSGFDMMADMKKQAQKFGTDVRFGVITNVDLSENPFKIIVDGREMLYAQTLIIATGATAKYLGLESENHYKGMGVSACATCDGFFHRNQDVIVVGGGDTACEEVNYLASICNKVYLVVRKDHLRASKVMQQRMMNLPNVEVLFEHTTLQVLGDENGVTGALLQDKNGIQKVIDATGFFLAIGHTPNTKLFAGALELDEEDYIKTIPGTSITNIPGVFAGGDVRDKSYKQAITAAASGCIAAIDCERYLISLG